MDSEYFLYTLGTTPETTERYPRDVNKPISIFDTNTYTDCTVVGFVLRTLDPAKKLPKDLRVTVRVGNQLTIDYNDATLYNLNLDSRPNTIHFLQSWEDWTLGVIPQLFPVGGRVSCEFYSNEITVPELLPSLVVLKEHPRLELIIKKTPNAFVGERYQLLGSMRRLIMRAEALTEESCREMLTRT